MQSCTSQLILSRSPARRLRAEGRKHHGVHFSLGWKKNMGKKNMGIERTVFFFWGGGSFGGWNIQLLIICSWRNITQKVGIVVWMNANFFLWSNFQGDVYSNKYKAVGQEAKKKMILMMARFFLVQLGLSTFSASEPKYVRYVILCGDWNPGKGKLPKKKSHFFHFPRGPYTKHVRCFSGNPSNYPYICIKLDFVPFNDPWSLLGDFNPQQKVLVKVSSMYSKMIIVYSNPIY